MRTINLRTRLVLLLVVPALEIFFLGMLYIVVASSVTAQFTEWRDTDLKINTTLGEIKLSGARLISSANEFILDQQLGLEEEEEETEEETEEDEVLAEIESYQTNLDLYRSLLGELDAETTVLFADIETPGNELVRLGLSAITLEAGENNLEAIEELRINLENTEEDFLLAIDAAIQSADEDLADSQARIATLLTTTEVLAVIMAIVALIAIPITLLYGARTVFNRFNSIVVTAEKLGHGDLTIRSPVTGEDEIAQFARTFNSMADQITTRIAEVNEARTQAERSDQIKSAFLASMSHELRTPLNAIINYTKFVARGDVGEVNDDQKEMLNEAIESAKHLLALINDVLDMSKIETGSLNLFITEDVNLDEILRHLVLTGKALIEHKPITIETQIASNLPRIRGDSQRISQALLNIISNACKFTEQGTIVITAEKLADSVIISVTDTGPGIDLVDQDLVFQAFKQTDTGLRRGDGTGLGMPICKSLVEAHDGQIHLESQPGVGATFTVTLPIRSNRLVPTLG